MFVSTRIVDSTHTLALNWLAWIPDTPLQFTHYIRCAQRNILLLRARNIINYSKGVHGVRALQGGAGAKRTATNPEV